MKWLQWSTADLRGGLGGVEVHARCLVRELNLQGVEGALSQDWNDLVREDWDVIHTHGSAVSPRALRFLSSNKRKGTWIHTLHGTTLGRMAACGEWLWPGGYAAEARELSGVLMADGVTTVNPNLSLFKLAKRLKKPATVCWNGWNSFDDQEAEKVVLPREVSDEIEKLGPAWLFVGRGRDRVKGADLLRKFLATEPGFRLIAVPGDGFEDRPDVFKTGRLSSAQVRQILIRSNGLIVPSLYEGNSLAVLEALALGVPVFSSRVGSAAWLEGKAKGLFVLEDQSATALRRCWQSEDWTLESQSLRTERAEWNRKLIPTWGEVAQVLVEWVRKMRVS